MSSVDDMQVLYTLISGKTQTHTHTHLMWSAFNATQQITKTYTLHMVLSGNFWGEECASDAQCIICGAEVATHARPKKASAEIRRENSKSVCIMLCLNLSSVAVATRRAVSSHVCTYYLYSMCAWVASDLISFGQCFPDEVNTPFCICFRCHRMVCEWGICARQATVIQSCARFFFDAAYKPACRWRDGRSIR